MCPLKEAARDAPHAIAILSKQARVTFSELDRYADTIEPRMEIKEPPTPRLIAELFAAWRRGQSIFPLNPRLPQTPTISNPPPNSLLILTSGSTSSPKIAVLSLLNLITNASTALAALDLQPGDQWRLSLPLYHVGGIGIVIRCILARACIVLDDSPDITHLSYIPTHLYRSTPIYRKLRCLALGGAPIGSYPQHLPVRTTYGLTEMGSMVCLDGCPLPQREVQLADDGEILVAGPCLFQGYLGEKPHRGWFATGDLGRYQNHRLEIIGRKDWMFISGGENIQPEEIERELLSLPQVLEAVVLPIDDAEFGKRPAAIVRPACSLDLKEMQQALSSRLPKFKIPTALYLVDEILQKEDLKLNRFILSQYIKNQSDQHNSGQKKAPYL